MLSDKEKAYIIFWEANRHKQKKNSRQFVIGLTAGLSMGAATILLIVSGWYQRANMVANSKLSPSIFAIIIIAIAVFMAFLYRKYKWEMHEQQYLEIMAKKKREEKNQPLVQQQVQ